jgi:RNA polymerase sigma factor (sigma-70 family)
MELSDTHLWERARAGDAEAFGLIYDRHAQAIYNYCFRRVGSGATAEDLLSIVFLEAWRRREKSLPVEGALPWLYGIATNVVRNQRRSERRYAAALRRMPEPRPEPDFSAASHERDDAERRIKPALALLGRLSADERDVFVLCAWMELPYEEAALALSIPLGTVRSRLARARRRLGELNSACGHIEDRTATIEEALEP